MKLALPRMTLKAADGGALSGSTRELLKPLNLHYAGVGVLVLLNLYLLAQIGLAWRAASSQNEDALAAQRVSLKTAEIAAKPLQGLDAKLTRAKDESDGFYKRRLPVSYSEVAAELGALSKKNAVKLTRVQYAQAPVLGDEDGALTEVLMDASLSGDYRPLVEFINGLERDRQFFLINGVTLTGAQSGTVNLRVRLTTYLRAPGSAEEMKRVQIGTGSDDKDAEAPISTPTPTPRSTPAKTGGAR